MVPASLRKAIEAEKALRAADPLREAYGALTSASAYGAGCQRAFVQSAHRTKVLEGGNQSGKTLTGVVDFLLNALGIHPTKSWEPLHDLDTWRGWFCTTTYKKFSEQAWKHFKALLFYPGEQTSQLPSRKVLSIGWIDKNPETPSYFRLRRADGREAEIWIKSYEQGAGEFQAAEVDQLNLDEECNGPIFEEAQPRLLARNGCIAVTATPVEGQDWLADLRKRAEEGDRYVRHVRLDTRDNPGLTDEALLGIQAEFIGRPDLYRLRMEGYPLALEGLVYSDWSFTPGHVVDPFELPRDDRGRILWTLRRCLDPGYRNCGCLWLGTDRLGDMYLYRDYKGQERTIAQNAKAVRELGAGDGAGEEAYYDRWADPAILGRTGESGQRVIDLYDAEGLKLSPAPNNRVLPGIELVKQAMLAKGGANGEHPQLRVFRSCLETLKERRLYRWPDARDRGDERQGVQERPEKREDHLMDCLRYLIAAGAGYRSSGRPLPPPGTVGRRLLSKRHERAASGRLK